MWDYEQIMRFIIRVIINALALWITSWVLPGFTVSTGGTLSLAQGNSTVATVLAFLFIGLIFGLVNALVKPIVALLSLPVTILTLGLFTLIINAAMLWLTAWLSSYTTVALHIDRFFWTAVLAAIIITVISLIASAITGVNRRSRRS